MFNRLLRCIATITVMLNLTYPFACRKFIISTARRDVDRSVTAVRSAFRELLIVNTNETRTSVNILALLRNALIVKTESQPYDRILWSRYSEDYLIQIDSTTFEDMFVSGKNQLSATETASKWNELLDSRVERTVPSSNINDAAPLQLELAHALKIVQTASYMAKSLQELIASDTFDKDDSSPVTLADFAVQALIIDSLSQRFPSDQFIAEESSEILKINTALRKNLLRVLSQATGESWTDSRLYASVDLGAGGDENDGDNSYNMSTSKRVWTLDPIDGTKGFIRKEHFCIALALIMDGEPKLSVLGCPNLQLSKVLENGWNEDVGKIDCPEKIVVAESSMGGNLRETEVRVFQPTSGSIFYAVSGSGAFVKTLGMPISAGFEAATSSLPDTVIASEASICEAAEPKHSSRALTARTAEILGISSKKKSFIRLDGQCKYALVGAGRAEIFMRLPPKDYREKIWDHAAGSHFVQEAGGKVSDLSGESLDFSLGRYLRRSVSGIVATCGGAFHSRVLEALSIAEREEEELKGRGGL